MVYRTFVSLCAYNYFSMQQNFMNYGRENYQSERIQFSDKRGKTNRKSPNVKFCILHWPWSSFIVDYNYSLTLDSSGDISFSLYFAQYTNTLHTNDLRKRISNNNNTTRRQTLGRNF